MSSCITRVKSAKNSVKDAVGISDEPISYPEDIPTHMQCVILKEYFNNNNNNSMSDILYIDNEHSIPTNKDSNVLIKVHACAINPMDIKVMKGILALTVKSPPLIPGRDVSGVVVYVGKDCERIKVGDQVFADASSYFGTFAEYVSLPEALVCHKPESLSHIEAAAIPLSGLTAYKSLIINGQIRKGNRVLINGASGGVGTLAIQIAKKLGAEYIVATCSERNNDLVINLGADRTIDYRIENWWDVLEGENFDLILDCVGGKEQWINSAKVLRPKYGRFVTLVGDNVAPSSSLGVTDFLKATSRIINRKFWSLIGYSNYDLTFTPSGYEILSELSKWCDEGDIKPVIDKTYHINNGLDDIIQLYETSESGHARGKLILEFIKND